MNTIDKVRIAQRNAAEDAVIASLPPELRPVPNVSKVDQLRADFSAKHRECEKAAHALACELEVGREREIAFEQYEIIRTAPRVARQS